MSKLLPYEQTQIRKKMESSFYEILGDFYGQLYDFGGAPKFSNNTFIISEIGEANLENNPCFYHKPSKTKLVWRGSPLECLQINRELSDEDFREILFDCANSITSSSNKNKRYKVRRWWEEEKKKTKDTK